MKTVKVRKKLLAKREALGNLNSLISSCKMALCGEWDLGIEISENISQGFLLMLEELKEVQKFVRSQKA